MFLGDSGNVFGQDRTVNVLANDLSCIKVTTPDRWKCELPHHCVEVFDLKDDILSVTQLIATLKGRVGGRVFRHFGCVLANITHSTSSVSSVRISSSSSSGSMTHMSCT